MCSNSKSEYRNQGPARRVGTPKENVEHSDLFRASGLGFRISCESVSLVTDYNVDLQT